MSRIVVTGGLGFIGSHTVVELLNSGHELIIIDNLSNSEMSVLDGIEAISKQRPTFHNVDLKDKAALIQAFTEVGQIDGVIHFAAYKAVGESTEKPLSYYQNNVGGLINLLETMALNNVPHIIFSSSCTVYGKPSKLPVTENTEVQVAASPYGNTKIICEDILKDSSQSSENLKVISLRYFNPIGAHESRNIGELPIGVPNNLMPFITQTAAGVRASLSVFGADYETPDGTGIRDYIHVVDLAKAHVSALARLENKENESAFEVFNVGTGRGYSVLEVINSFEKVSGQKLDYNMAERRAGDIAQIYADTSLSNQKLKWTAEKSLDEMTLSAWNWEKKLRQID